MSLSSNFQDIWTFTNILSVLPFDVHAPQGHAFVDRLDIDIDSRSDMLFSCYANPDYPILPPSAQHGSTADIPYGPDEEWMADNAQDMSAIPHGSIPLEKHEGFLPSDLFADWSPKRTGPLNPTGNISSAVSGLLPEISPANHHTRQSQHKTSNLHHKANTNNDADASTRILIGTFHLNGDIKCQHPTCNRSYSRLAELKRHYETQHATVKPEYWCDVPLCERSVALGGRPFHRADKMRDHARRVHRRN